MNIFLRILLFSFLLLMMATTVTNAQNTGSVSGNIVDKNTKKPLPGVNVFLQGTSRGTSTDQNGIFMLKGLPEGSQTLTFSFTGYKKMDKKIVIKSGEKTDVTIYLIPDILQLRGIQVSSLRPHQITESNLDEADIQQANIRDSGELLRNVQGVSAVRRGPVGLDPVIRGLRETEVGAYIDGTRTFPAGPARMDSPISHIDPSAIKNIKILKGPYALTLGAGNMSTIQVETQPLQTLRQPFTGSVSSGYDSNLDAVEESASLQGNTGKFGYWINGAWRTGNDYKAGNGQSIPADFLSREIRAKIGYAVSDHSFVDVSAGYQNQDDIDFPGRLLNANFFNAYNFSANWKWNPQNSLFSSVKANAYINTVNHAMFNDDKPTAQPDPNRMPPFALDITVDARSQTSGGRFAATLDASPSWSFEFGADIYDANRDATRNIDRRDDGMKPAAFPLFDIIWPDATIIDGGLFTKANHTFNDQWSASGTVRVDLVSADGDSVSQFFADNVATKLDANETNLNGAFTLNYVPNANWTIGLGLGSVVRTADALERYSDRFPASKAQTSAEFVGDPNLDPERNTQADLWIDARYPNWNVSVNLFARKMDNYITITPTNLPKRLPLSPNTVFKYINGSARFWGFDVSSAYRLVRQLKLKAGLSYLRGEDEELDEPALGVAPLRLDTGLRFESSQKPLYVEGSMHWNGKQDRVATSRGETSTDGYVTADLNAGVNVWKRISLQGGIKNITNKNYVNHLNAKNPYTGQQIPEAGRVFHIDVSVQF